MATFLDAKTVLAFAFMDYWNAGDGVIVEFRPDRRIFRFDKYTPDQGDYNFFMESTGRHLLKIFNLSAIQEVIDTDLAKNARRYKIRFHENYLNLLAYLYVNIVKEMLGDRQSFEDSLYSLDVKLLELAKGRLTEQAFCKIYPC